MVRVAIVMLLLLLGLGACERINIAPPNLEYRPNGGDGRGQ